LQWKRAFGGGLRAKQEESQEREAALACQLLNRMRTVGSSAVLARQLKAGIKGSSLLPVD